MLLKACPGSSVGRGSRRSMTGAGRPVKGHPMRDDGIWRKSGGEAGEKWSELVSTAGQDWRGTGCQRKPEY